MHKTLIAGIGKMGINHAKCVMSGALPDIELTAACDSDADMLMVFREKFPDIPVYLTPKNEEFDPDQVKKARAAHIEIRPGVADIINEHHCDTLINATHNKSHVPVLKDAFSLRDDSGAPVIKTVFQEKPFAHDLTEAQEISGFIAEHDVDFNLNGILTFSPIWKEFYDAQTAIENQGYSLNKIKCSYGKDRTQDTRPAQGGWVGMEAIHALDISTAGLTDLALKPESVNTITGFLAENAADKGGDGIVTYALEAELTARQPNGANVDIQLEGSYAWAEQYRRVQYEYTDKSGQSFTLQLDFDRRNENGVNDVLTVCKRDQNGHPLGAPHIVESNADKLSGYYASTLDPNDPRPTYDLSRAMAVQKTLNDLGQDFPTRDIHSRNAPKYPKTPAATETFKMHSKPVSQKMVR